MARHAVPEERRDVAVARLAGQFVLARGADDFRDLRVGVQAVERVFLPGQRIEDGRVVEEPRQAQVLGIAGDAVEGGQHLVHAAELGLQHRLLLRRGQPVHAQAHPRDLLQQDVERLLVAAELVHVQQPGHHLVQRVVGGPDAGARFDAVDQFFRKRGEVAGVESLRRQRRLNRGQLRDQRVAAVLEPQVAGGRIHQREGRQVVAGVWPRSSTSGASQPPNGVGRRGHARSEAKRVQEAILIEFEQVSPGREASRL